jgi:4-azaleucine resistance transporter AzlC
LERNSKLNAQQSTPRGTSPKSEFLAGFRDTFPLVVGAIPFGIIYGALAITSGLSAAATLALSVFVFAGASQFVAVGLVASGVGIGLIIITTFIVNVRHALYGATLSPYMKSLPHRWLLPLGFWLTDESFLVTIRRYKEPDVSPYKHWYFLGSAIFMYGNWQICTYVGMRAGQAIPDPGSWGLDFAMVVTFIGMLVPLVRGKPVVATVLAASITSLAVNDLPNQMGLIVAAVTGIVVGSIVEIAGRGESIEGSVDE